MGKFWKNEELKILYREYPKTPTWHLAKRLNRTIKSVWNKAHCLGIFKAPGYFDIDYAIRCRPEAKPGSSTWFRPGHTPHNKGKKGWDSGGRSHKTRFKPGDKSHTWRSVGSVRIGKDGYFEIKVSDTGQNDWKYVHILVWESEHGPVPEGYIVSFVNKNRMDIRIENLEMITRAENMRRNSIQNLPAELQHVCKLRARLNRCIKEREKNEK
jgi:hypothetical protein